MSPDPSRPAAGYLDADTIRRLIFAAENDDREPNPVSRGVLAELVDVVRAALPDGTACEHVGPTPEPVVVLAWQPDQVLCGPCADAALDATVGAPDEETCDLCGAYSQHFRGGMTASGSILIAYGLCDSCAGRGDTTPRRGT